jgi:hypothetical protein
MITVHFIFKEHYNSLFQWFVLMNAGLSYYTIGSQVPELVLFTLYLQFLAQTHAT